MNKAIVFKICVFILLFIIPDISYMYGKINIENNKYILYRIFLLLNFYIQIISLCAFSICKNNIKSVMIISGISMIFHIIINVISIVFIRDENSSNNIYNSFIEGIFIIMTIVGSIRTIKKNQE